MSQGAAGQLVRHADGWYRKLYCRLCKTLYEKRLSSGRPPVYCETCRARLKTAEAARKYRREYRRKHRLTPEIPKP